MKYLPVMLLLMGLVGCGSKVSDVNPSVPVVSTSHTELQSLGDSQSTGKTSAPTEEAKPWDTPTHLVLFMVGNINESRTRDGHRDAIVWALAMAGQTEQALEVVQQIEPGTIKAITLSGIALAEVDAEKTTQVLDSAQQNKDLLLMYMAMGLATEPVPERKRDNMRPATSRRMKKAFTTNEKGLAKQLVDASKTIG